MTRQRPMRIGTRRSRLARAQAQIGRAAVQVALSADAEIVELGTTGDAISARRPRGRWENTDGQFTGVKLTSGPLQRNLTPLQQQIQQLMDTLPFNPSQIGQGDNTPRAGVIEPVFNQVGQAMLQGKAEPKAELAKVDAAWAVAPQ